MSGARTNGDGVEIWRGSVSPREIDEMGHFNVQYYVALAAEGLAVFAAHLGLDQAFRADARSTLLVREHHIRFLREAKVGDALTLTGGILDMGETDARLLFVLRHTLGGEPCASFNLVVSHVTAYEARPFAWPSAAQARAPGLTVALPSFAAARSVGIAPFETSADAGKAKRLGLTRIASGAFGPSHCDVFGRMEAQHFIGRISGGVSTLGETFQATIADRVGSKPKRLGIAALEYRLAYLAWPRAGDRFEIHSGVTAVTDRGRNLVHWMLDPATGKPWGVAEAFLISFDLDARKMLRIAEPARAELSKDVVQGLRL